MDASTQKVLTVFGTRPEAIKLAPVIGELQARAPRIRVVNVLSGQHRELIQPFLELFDLPIHHDLAVMRPNQSPALICSRVLESLDPILADERPDLVLVQGDTTTALAGALAAFYRRIPVGHVEAGLRSGDASSPFPEEMNRRLITRMATYHFAATEWNQATLLAEGVPPQQVFLTGNPIVQALHDLLSRSVPAARAAALLERTSGYKRILLTTHRRESFGSQLERNLAVIRRFVETHSDVAVIFPVHANPQVSGPAQRILSSHPRIHLTEPLCYKDFIQVMSRAWLVVSDSGGVQEEAPSLGKPVLVIRENTERPEAITAGVARLVGGDPAALMSMLQEVYAGKSWGSEARTIENPFGSADSGRRVADAIEHLLMHAETPDLCPAIRGGNG